MKKTYEFNGRSFLADGEQGVYIEVKVENYIFYISRGGQLRAIKDLENDRYIKYM